MKDLFKKYVGNDVGINFKDLRKFHAARLVNACDTFFTIEGLKSEQVKIHYNYSNVITACEISAGTSTAEIFSPKKVNFLIQVNHLVVGSGGGIGIGIGGIIPFE